MANNEKYAHLAVVGVVAVVAVVGLLVMMSGGKTTSNYNGNLAGDARLPCYKTCVDYQMDCTNSTYGNHTNQTCSWVCMQYELKCEPRLTIMR